MAKIHCITKMHDTLITTYTFHTPPSHILMPLKKDFLSRTKLLLFFKVTDSA